MAVYEFCEFRKHAGKKSALVYPTDRFEDPLEGTFTYAEIDQLRSRDGTEEHFGMKLSNSYLNVAQCLRSATYVNSWREGAEESLAMWDIYGRGIGTVAVKTDVRLLTSPTEIRS